MQKIPVMQIRDGMVLARPIQGPDGKTLLSQGETLKAALAPRLQKWSIGFVYIEAENEEAAPNPQNAVDGKIGRLEETFTDALQDANMKTIFLALKKHITENA